MASTTLPLTGRRSAAPGATLDSIKNVLTSSPTPPTPSASGVQELVRRISYLWVAVALQAVITLGTVTVLLIRYTTPTASVCTTAVCREFEKHIRDSVDDKINPCDNFHKYVCGRWRRSNTVGVAQRILDSFEDGVRYTMSTILVPAKEQTPTQKAAKFYQTCTSVLQGDGDIKGVHDVLRRVGLSWPHRADDPDILQAIIRLNEEYQEGPGLRCWKRGNSVQFKPSENYKDILQRRREMLKEPGRYKSHFDLISKSFADPGRKIIQFEDLIAIETVMVPAMESAIALQNCKMAFSVKSQNGCIANVSVNTSSEEHIRLLTPKVTAKRWRNALDAYLHIPSNETALLLIQNEIFFRAYFGKLKEPELHFYQGWIAIQVMVHSTSAYILKSFYGSSSDIRKLHGDYCSPATKSYLGYALYCSFVPSAYAPAIRKDITSVMNSISRNFNSTLLSDVGHQVVLKTNPDAAFGFIEKCDVEYLNKAYSRYEDMKDTFTHNTKIAIDGFKLSVKSDVRPPDFTVDGSVIFYGPGWPPLEGNVVMPYAMVFPTYDTGAPVSVKYGALGSKIADATARLLVASSSNWKPHAWDKMNGSVQCLFGSNASLSTLTPEQQRIVQDFVSVKQLYQAFRDADQSGGTNTEVMMGFSGDMLFFISWCLLQCEGRDSPPLEACNIPLKHTPTFAKAFGCTDTSQMVVLTRCVFFQSDRQIQETKDGVIFHSKGSTS